MKEVSAMLIIGLLCVSMMSLFTLQIEASGPPPVGYWKFDDSLGAVAADSSGNGNTGTLMNGPQWMDGVIGGALMFDGVDDYVLIPHSASLDIIGNQMTVEYWMKLSIDWHAGMGYHMNIYDKGDAYVGSMFGDTGVHVFNLPYIPPYPGTNRNDWITGVWYHMADVYNGTHINLYVDGVLDKSEAVTGMIPRSTHNLAIGAQCVQAWPWFFNGTLDELAIYNYARTAEEIMEDYMQGVAPPSPPVGGQWLSVNKIRLLFPLIALASLTTMTVVAFVYVKRKRNQD